MPEFTPSERRALALAAALAALGAAARIGLGPGPEAWSWRPAGPTPEAPLDSVRAAVARGLERERRAARPLAPGERIDPNRVDAAELRRLPGVGPVTARALLRHRREHGPFASREDLLRVPGVGPRTLERIAPHLALPGRAGPAGPGRPLDLNRATEAELEGLPGIGPGLAAAIVRWRDREGPFRRPEDLLRVPGVGPARLAAVRGRVRAGPL